MGRNEGIRSFIVALFVVGLFLPYQSLRAATAFTETWVPLEYRVAYITLTDIFSSSVPANASPEPPDTYPNDATPTNELRPFCLGPSKWAVTTVLNGQIFNETWTAGDWLDTQDQFGVHWVGNRRDGVSIRYDFSTTCENNNGFAWQKEFKYTYQSCMWGVCYDSEIINNSTPIQVHPTGLYGGLITHYGDTNVKWGLWLYKSGIRSIPTKWHVEGDIGS